MKRSFCLWLAALLLAGPVRALGLLAAALAGLFLEPGKTIVTMRNRAMPERSLNSFARNSATTSRI